MDSREAREVMFTPVRLRSGYSMVEVDDFLDRVATALDGGAPLTVAEAHAKRFPAVRLREGYDMLEVDKFMDRVEAELARREAESPVAPVQRDAGFEPHCSTCTCLR